MEVKSELKIFNHPRPKKSVLGNRAPKKRKTEHKIAEINFDFDARAEYLTGFHKRKLERAKKAQVEAAKKAKEEKIVIRKQLREERKVELEEHVSAVNALLAEADKLPGELDSDEEVDWEGIKETLPPIDHEEEYIDEDKYTKVTVEEVDVSKEGLQRAADESEEEYKPVEKKEKGKLKKVWPKKVKKEKFRYESKAERRATRGKIKAKNREKSDARKGND
ncbi:putative ribosomal RNA-processing protein 17 [Calycina marina]|uniref:Ribosomal RNA-processing protein 17 n=1 Tax=Calycina marina TaxID=1763456 RepID=A0A9P8CDM2_9HELO|nr:putative ribosomal RNA-processing protein 17 [Calycina marina]